MWSIASQWHEMFCHDPVIISSNLDRVEIWGLNSPFFPKWTLKKHTNYLVENISVNDSFNVQGHFYVVL